MTCWSKSIFDDFDSNQKMYDYSERRVLNTIYLYAVGLYQGVERTLSEQRADVETILQSDLGSGKLDFSLAVFF